MNVRGIVVFAVIFVVVLAILGKSFEMDPRERNLEVFTEMVYSKAYESFSESPDLPGGLTQQALVAGVVRRGQMPLRFGRTPEEALRAGRELVSPIAKDDTASAARGRDLYRIYCSVCHDLAGGGRGPVVLRGMLPPPLLTAVRSKAMADGEMFHILTYGQGNMASYAAQLTRRERWMVIEHVRSLQGSSE